MSLDFKVSRDTTRLALKDFSVFLLENGLSCSVSNMGSGLVLGNLP